MSAEELPSALRDYRVQGSSKLRVKNKAQFIVINGFKHLNQVTTTFFAQLNEPLIALSQSLPKGHRPKQVVSYSHFLPHPRLHRGPKFLGEIEGSSVLGEQVRRLKPDTHVFGHTHINTQNDYDGCTYIQNAMGYGISPGQKLCVVHDQGRFKQYMA